MIEYPSPVKAFKKVISTFLIILGAFLASATAFGHGHTGAPDESNAVALEPRFMKQAVKSLRFGLKSRFEETLISAFDCGVLPPWLLEFNKNMLDSAAPHALLFTSGRQDTLGLWYWQYIKGHRRDVTVLPMGMLSQNWFVLQLLEKPLLHPGGISMHHSRLEILEGKSSAWSGAPVYLYGASHPLQCDYQSLSNETYAAQTLGVHFEMLTANKADRPVYYAPFLKTSFLRALSRHLCREGVLYRLQPEAAYTSPEVDFQATYHWLMNGAQFDAISKSRYNLADSLAYFYASIHDEIIADLTERGLDQEALQLQHQMMNVLNGRIACQIRKPEEVPDERDDKIQ